MKLTITLDATPIKRFVLGLKKAHVLTGLGALVLAGASTYAYAITNTPTNTFVAGSPISAASVNTNFTELYASANTSELDIVALQAEVTAAEATIADLEATRLSACTWRYEFKTGTTGTVSCPATHYAISGACGSLTGNLTNSRPAGIGGGTAELATNSTGWTCNQATSGGLDVRALCCPE